MRTKDIMTAVSLEEYLKEIMKISLADGKKGKDPAAYNTSGGERKPSAAGKTREFGRYRSIILREKKTRVNILRLSQQLLKEEKSGECKPYKKAELRELAVELGRLTLRRRELEKKRDDIECDFLREIINHRYFEDTERRIPTWSQTACELGIAISGEELRRYVSMSLVTA